MGCGIKERLKDPSFRIAGVLVVVGIIACLVNACGALLEDESIHYTFKDLGFKTKSFGYGESASIDFNCQYENAGGTIKLHLYNTPHMNAGMDLKLNDIELLHDKFVDSGDQWIETEVPVGIILYGSNTIVLDFRPSDVTTLLDNSYINISANGADGQEGLPDGEDLQSFAPKDDISIVNLIGNGPDLAVTYLEAIGGRSDINAGDFTPVNDIVFVNFTVTNIGNDAVVENFTTKIYVNDTNKIEIIDTPHLDGGESFSGHISYTAPFAILIAKPVIVFTDADHNVTELNEENNVMEEFAGIGLA